MKHKKNTYLRTREAKPPRSPVLGPSFLPAFPSFPWPLAVVVVVGCRGCDEEATVINNQQTRACEATCDLLVPGTCDGGYVSITPHRPHMALWCNGYASV